MKRPRVCVIGLGGQSAFLSAQHFPAPGETVSCKDLFFELGGKGYNQAVACARMGVDTTFIGAVGYDVYGDACRSALEAEGITAVLVPKETPTAFACITTDAAGENIVQVFPGAARELTPEDLRSPRIMEYMRQCDWLLLQNELSARCLVEACGIGRELGMRIVINPAPAVGIPMEVLRCGDWITPNSGEVRLLAGLAPESKVTPMELAEALNARGIRRAVITLGAEGALIMDGDRLELIPSYRHGMAVDTTGAGDTFTGVLTASLATGSDIVSAAGMGAVAAGIGVTRHGAVGSIPTGDEVRAVVALREKGFVQLRGNADEAR